MASQRSSASIFNGTEEIIFSFLGLEPGKTLKHKSVCRRLSSAPPEWLDFETLISGLYEQIERNRSDRIPSRENWRTKRVTTLSDINSSPEVLLERAIAILGEGQVLGEWFNQIPVASGLVDHRADGRAAIDLMRLDGDRVEFVELKWGSDTPAFAAFEILLYGLAFLYCYINRVDLGYENTSLMKVKEVSLQVLAPLVYFGGYNFTWLGLGLDAGIRNLTQTISNGELSMDFGFTSFPSDFNLPFGTGQEVRQFCDPKNGEGIQAIVSAIQNIKPIWPSKKAENP
jgi:hypothetical protein